MLVVVLLVATVPDTNMALQGKPDLFERLLDEPMPICLYLSIEQDIDVVLIEDVPATNMPTTLTSPGGGGV